jgi:hypothetical protein
VKAHRAMNLDDAMTYARKLGCDVHNVDGTGEAVVVAPDREARVRFNVRKKDAPPQLVTLLRRLEKAVRR